MSVQVVADSALLSLNVGTLVALAQEDAGIGWAIAEELTRRLYDVLGELSGKAFGSVVKGLPDICSTWPSGTNIEDRCWLA